MPSRSSRPSRTLLLGAVAIVAVLLSACGASDPPPPTNPLDDRLPEVTAPPGVDPGTPPPLNGANDDDDTADPGSPNEPSTPGTSNGLPDATPGAGTDPAPDEEAAVARGIELMAESLGAPASDLEFVSAAPDEWLSACIGVEWPGVACAEVVTPGWRVELQTLLRETVHVVHVSESGRFAWVPEREAEARILSVDRAGGAIEVDADGDRTRWLVVPGSQLDLAFDELEAGMMVRAGLDELRDGTGIVWLVVTGL